MKALTPTIVLSCALCCAAPASAVYHKLSGYLPGEMVMDAAAGEGQALVAGGYTGFHVLDTSDPAHPVPLYTHVTDGPAWRVIEHDSRAYVIDWWNGMLVFDVSDPAAPELLGESPAFNFGYDVLVEGDLAYVGTGSSLRCMNVSDPAHIDPLHVFHVDDGVWSLQKVGNTMYAAGWGAGMLILDVTNPTSFSLRHVIDTIDRAYVVEVVGDVAFVADGWAGVLAIDISDPVHPVLLCQYDLPGCVQWLDVQGPTAYATDLECGLHVLDVSDPTHITAIDAFHVPGSANRAVVRDSLAYVASSNGGLHILDIRDPVVPIRIGTYDAVAGTNEVRVAGKTAFLADEYSDLVLVDVTVPSQPEYLAGIDFGFEESARCVDVEDSQVVCGTNNFGGGNLKFCTTLPGVPIQLDASFMAYGAVSSVELQNGICYAATVEDWDCSVECVDASDPHHPQLLSRVQMEFLGSLCVKGDYVLCAVQAEGLWIYDFSNPYAPARVGLLDTPGLARAVAVAGGYAFVADDEAGVQIVDVTDPHDPQWVGTLRPHDDCIVSTRPEVQGNRLYVTDENWNTIHTYDITDPANPVLIDEDAWNYRSLSLCAADGLLYTANLWAGMCALDLHAVSGVAEPGNGDWAAAAGSEGFRLSVASPFRSAATVTFDIGAQTARAELSVFDAAGRKVTTLVDGHLRPGSHSVVWLGRDDNGRDLPAGLYCLGLRAGSRSTARKLLLVR